MNTTAVAKIESPVFRGRRVTDVMRYNDALQIALEVVGHTGRAFRVLSSPDGFRTANIVDVRTRSSRRYLVISRHGAIEKRTSSLDTATRERRRLHHAIIINAVTQEFVR